MYLVFWLILVIVNLVLVLCGDKFNVKSKKIMYVFFLLMSSVLVALRPENAPDFKSYSRIYEYIQVGENYGFNLLRKEYLTGVEYGFIYLIQTFKIFFGNNFRLFLFFVCIFSVIATIEFFMKIVCKIELLNNELGTLYNARIIMLLLFMSYYGLNYQGIAIRQALSIAFSIGMLYYFIDKKYIVAVLCIFTAFLMHRMSLIALLLIIVYRFFPIIYKKKVYLYMGVLCSIISFFLSSVDFFSSILTYMKKLYVFLFKYINYNTYIDEVDMVVSIDKKRIVVIFLLFILIYFSKVKCNFSRILNIYIVGVLILVLTSNIAGSARIYDYLVVFYIPLLGVEYIEQREQILFKAFIGVLTVVNYIISFRIWNFI